MKKILLIICVVILTSCNDTETNDATEFYQMIEKNGKPAIVSGVSDETNFEHASISVQCNNGKFLTYYGEEITYLEVGDTLL